MNLSSAGQGIRFSIATIINHVSGRENQRGRERKGKSKRGSNDLKKKIVSLFWFSSLFSSCSSHLVS